jgi:hypothetical protein
MPAGVPAGAMCVQRFDDSLNSAIHITYRISLRSSSMPEPRDPLLKVLIVCFQAQRYTKNSGFAASGGVHRSPPSRGGADPAAEATTEVRFTGVGVFQLCNDPSAGSPTETLLRLLLPLNDRVRTTFRRLGGSCPPPWASPKASLSRSIGSSDGRCVQRAGT